MTHTAELLNKALAKQRQSAWARQLNISDSALTQAKKRGRLSPTLAGRIAEEMGEDATKWIAVAGLEQEPDSEYRDKMLEIIWRKR